MLAGLGSISTEALLFETKAVEPRPCILTAPTSPLPPRPYRDRRDRSLLKPVAAESLAARKSILSEENGR